MMIKFNSFWNGIAGKSAGKNPIDGSDGNDFLFGGFWSDTLNGGAGDDRLIGGWLSDTLNGGTGNDFLYGGIGHDILIGGAGSDSLYGGIGNDTFMHTFESAAASNDYDTYVGGFGTDKLVLDITKSDLQSAAMQEDLARFEEYLAAGQLNKVFVFTAMNLEVKSIEEIEINILDTGISLEVSDAQAVEGDELVYTVTLSEASTEAETYTFDLAAGSATAGADFSSTPVFSNGVVLNDDGTITVPAGVESFTVSYATTDDNYADDGETTKLTIDGVAAVGTINDEADPTQVIKVSLTGDAEVNEGDAATYTVSVEEAPVADLVVQVTYDIKDTETGEVSQETTEVTLAAGETSVNFSVSNTDDTTKENSEVYNVAISIADSQTGGFESVIVDADNSSVDTTIIDNDGTPTLTVGAAQASEGNDLVHTVTLSNTSIEAETYTFSLEAATATAGEDVELTPVFSDGVVLNNDGTITVAAGVSEFTVSYATLDDIYADDGETTKLTIDGVEAVGTINDNLDPSEAIKLSLTGSNEVAEGAEATYTVSIEEAVIEDLTVQVIYDVKDTSSGEVSQETKEVTIQAGETEVSFVVANIDDSIKESDEVYNVAIAVSDTQNGGFEAVAIDANNSNVDTTIVDNDKKPEVTVENAQAVEGDKLVHTVTLENAAEVDVSYEFELYSGSAKAGVDFETTVEFSNGVAFNEDGTITVPAGVSEFTVSYATINDVYADDKEASNLIVGGFEASGIILDGLGDDLDVVTVSIEGSGSVDEGAEASYTVTVSEVATKDLTVDIVYDIKDTATGEVSQSTQQVTIVAGKNSAEFTVANVDDDIKELNEVYNVAIANPQGGGFESLVIDADNASVDTSILDNEEKPTLTVNDASAVEGEKLVHTVTLSAASPVAETYAFSLDGVTATADEDFGTAVEFDNGVVLNSDGTISIPAGVKEFNVSYEAIDDIYADNGETTKLVIGGAEATGTINDEAASDLGVVKVSIIGAETVSEGGSAIYEVSVSEAPIADLTIDIVYDIKDTETGEIKQETKTVTLAAGQIATKFTVDNLDDNIQEGDEAYNVAIANPQGGGFESVVVNADKASVNTTIIDNDNKPTLTVSSAEAVEGNDLVHTVTLSGASSVDEAYALFLESNTATAGTDFETTPVFSDGVVLNNDGTITVPAGVTQFTVSYATIDDVYADDNEKSLLVVDGNEAFGTINDEAVADVVKVSITGDETVSEGDSAIYRVSVTDEPKTDLTLDITYDVKDTDTGEVTQETTMVTIKAGQTETKFTVANINDSIKELDEVYNVAIANPQGGGFESVVVDADKASVDTTIIDNDNTPTLTVSNTEATEGTNLVHTVTLSSASPVDEVYAFSLQGDSATAGLDFEMQPTFSDGVVLNADGTISVPAGVTEFTVSYATIDDIYAGSETTKLVIDGNEAVGSIVDESGAFDQNDPENTANKDGVMVSIESAASQVSEGENATFEMVLQDVDGNMVVPTSGVTLKLSCTFTLEDGRKIDQDQEVTIQQGYSGTDLSLPTVVNGINITDIAVTVTSVQGGNFEAIVVDQNNGTADVSVVDTTPVILPKAEIEDAIAVEGEALIFDVSLTESSSSETPVTVSISETTASKQDYADLPVQVSTDDGQTYQEVSVSTDGTFVINVPAEQTSGIKVKVHTADDVYAEGAETIKVSVKTPEQSSKYTATGTINDEAAADLDVVTVSITGDARVDEGETASFPVTLTDADGNPVVAESDVTVDLVYTKMDSQTGAEIVTVETVTIAAGTSSATLDIQTVKDNISKGNDAFTVEIANPVGGGFESIKISETDGSANLAVVDITEAPQVIVEDATAVEGEALVFDVSLSNPSISDTAVTIVLDSGTAKLLEDTDSPVQISLDNGESYTEVVVAKDGSFVIDVPAHTTDGIKVKVPTKDDFYAEDDETINISAQAVDQEVASTAKGTIKDETAGDSVFVSIVDEVQDVTEGGSANFAIELKDAEGNLVEATEDVVVEVSYSGDAVGGKEGDFVEVETVTIKAGSSSAELDIDTVEDSEKEGSELLNITLHSPIGAAFESIQIDDNAGVANVNIVDPVAAPAPTPPLTAPEATVAGAEVTEGEDLIFDISLTEATSVVTPVTVKLETGRGNDVDKSSIELSVDGGISYSSVALGRDGSFTIDVPAGTIDGIKVKVPTVDDVYAERTENIGISVQTPDQARASSATGTINDSGRNDLDTVKVSIVDNVDELEEGEKASFEVELRDEQGNLVEAASDVTVNIAYSGDAKSGRGGDHDGSEVITIKAGSSSATLNLSAIKDRDDSEGAESLNIQLEAPRGGLSNGGFEAIKIDDTADTADLNIIESARGRRSDDASSEEAQPELSLADLFAKANGTSLPLADSNTNSENTSSEAAAQSGHDVYQLDNDAALYMNTDFGNII